jgi:hypothetical protein
MFRFRRWMGPVLVGLMLVGLAGCGKVTKDNYDKVQTGMALSEVEAILGKGTEKAGLGGAVGNLTGSAKILTWGDDKKSITITFANDKVLTKAMNGL